MGLIAFISRRASRHDRLGRRRATTASGTASGAFVREPQCAIGGKRARGLAYRDSVPELPAMSEFAIDLDEGSALAVTAVRAFEIVDRTHRLWSDADRAWASRAAAERVGAAGTPQAFLVERARLALARLSERFKVLPRAARSLRWPSWLSVAVGVGAFVTGVAVDRVGDSQRINILTPPVLALLAWNLAVRTRC